MISSASASQSESEFLRMQHVNVARGDAVVLHDVNLRIATGEHVEGITSKLRESIDDHFWICRNDGPNGPGTADLRCLFVPRQES